MFLLVVLRSFSYVACPFTSLFLLSRLVNCSSLAVAGCPALPFLVGGHGSCRQLLQGYPGARAKYSRVWASVFNSAHRLMISCRQSWLLVVCTEFYEPQVSCNYCRLSWAPTATGRLSLGPSMKREKLLPKQSRAKPHTIRG